MSVCDLSYEPVCMYDDTYVHGRHLRNRRTLQFLPSARTPTYLAALELAAFTPANQMEQRLDTGLQAHAQNSKKNDDGCLRAKKMFFKQP